MDAKRLSDGEIVALKLFLKSSHPHEADIGLYLSSEPLASDPRNHCVNLYEVLSVPNKDDQFILVMPYLRPYQNPPFETVGEVVDFVHQAFEVSY